MLDEPPSKLNIVLFVSLLTIASSLGVFREKEIEKEPYYNYNDLFVGEVYVRFQPDTYILAEITAYNPTEEQCDSTPDITASGEKSKEGIIANNCLEFGTIVEIQGKLYEVQDRMNDKYGCEYFDILMLDKNEAINWGRRILQVKIY